jgi:hypothetical protein
MKLNKHERKQLVDWARRGLKGVKESACFVAVCNEGPLDQAIIEFYLQVGAAVALDKPFIATVPHGQPIPRKLALIADKIIYYNPEDPETLARGIAEAMNELGIKKH